jgi:DNA-binding transcriptional regulator YdaS (Cro superfamily)
MKPLARAVDVLGSQSALARVCGGKVKQAHVWYWLNEKDGELPAEHCVAVEQATAEKGDVVTRYELRPDVFGPSRAAEAVA